MKYLKNMHYACIACMTFDTVMKMEKKISTSLFGIMQIQNKEDKDV